MDEGLTRGQIIDAADRLIRDHGQENVKAAKVLELVLDDMLTNGYTAVDGSTVGPNPDYIAAKSAINGAQPATERTAEELPIWDVDGLGGANRGSLNSDFQNMQEQSDEFHRVNRTAEERTGGAARQSAERGPDRKSCDRQGGSAKPFRPSSILP